MAAAIVTRHLTKLYAPGKGVEGLDLTVPEGSLFGFLGPNGAGKTTTIRLLLDFLRPQHGSCQIFGRDCQQEALATRQQIGFLPGEVRLPESMRVDEFLRYLEQVRKRPFDPTWERTIAEALELDTRACIRTLSKGNKQKVGLLQALAPRPRLLVLDEPTEGLDPLVQQVFYALLQSYREGGGTVFMSSHILSEVERLCDRVAILRDGRLVTTEQIEVLRRRKVRHLELEFAADVDLAQFVAQLPGATLMSAHGRSVRLAVTDGGEAIVRALASAPIADFSFAPASLEEAFLDFYRSAP